MTPINEVRDRRIVTARPLTTPARLRRAVVLTARHQSVVVHSRQEIARILDAEDDRLMVVVGPCSVHDPSAALDYAHRLAALARELRSELLIVMRCYFEKPRTTVGWKGLINDPHLDGACDVAEGLQTARALLRDIVEAGLPVGCEFLDPIIPQYLSDLVSWGAIGARTAESPIHRQLASGLSMPVGIKNSTSGDVQTAVDAIRAASVGQVFIGITDDGVAAVITTSGNADCHVVLRGGTTGPNYGVTEVTDALGLLTAAGLPARLVVDASHGNSGKDHERQPKVVGDLAARIGEGERGIVGVMVESFLVPGRQDLPVGARSPLTYGQSVTDACLGWEDTEAALRRLARAVSTRRRREAPEPVSA